MDLLCGLILLVLVGSGLRTLLHRVPGGALAQVLEAARDAIAHDPAGLGVVALLAAAAWLLGLSGAAWLPPVALAGLWLVGLVSGRALFSEAVRAGLRGKTAWQAEAAHENAQDAAITAGEGAGAGGAQIAGQEAEGAPSAETGATNEQIVRKAKAAWKAAADPAPPAGGVSIRFLRGAEAAPEDLAGRLSRVRTALDADVVGQSRAKDVLLESLARAWSGVRAGKGPILSAIFTGPTGCGKTEMCEALARSVSWPLKFFPMGQAGGGGGTLAWKLFGPEPGYAGSQRGGELTRWVQANPESIVVFDEFEKPLRDDPTVYQSLLNALSEGMVKENSTGDTFDCSKSVFVFTSNLLSHEKLEGLDPRQLKDALGARASLPPEFLGRIQAVVPFSPLTKDQVARIAELTLSKVLTRFAGHNNLAVSVEVREGVLEKLLSKTDGRYGVRDLQGVIESEIGNALAAAWIQNPSASSRAIKVFLKSDSVHVSIE